MFWERFYNLCLSVGSKPNPIGKQIDISSATITQWKQGTTPAGDNLIKIANYFKCSVDYLLGLSDNPKPVSEKNLSYELSEDKQRLIAMYDLLTEREQGEILGELKSLTQGRAEAKNAETA